MNRKDNAARLSVAYISFNEAGRIEESLKSVKDIADEIVVIDSGSADDTVKIAESHGSKVYTEEWKGFAEQKNALFEKCSGDWILYLDCDEEVSADLAGEIISAINDPEAADGYFINRRTKYLGKILKRSWQPDMKIRLAKRTASPLWVGEYIHESLKINGGTERFKGEIIHRSYRNIYDHMAKTLKYAKLSGEAAYAKGKKPSVIKIVFVPPFSFFKSYVLKGGIIDGMRGLIAAFSAYVYFFLKYVFIWEKHLENNGKNKK